MACRFSALIVASLLLVGSAARAADRSPISVTGINTRKGQQLVVRNKTPFLGMVYVRNLRVAWLKPFGTTVIKGFQPGRHKLYATTRYGSSSWGPTGVWVPGNWTVTPRKGQRHLSAALVRRIYRNNRSSLVACDKLASRRGERLAGQRADFQIRVDEKGVGAQPNLH